jgi:hypothetical protein
MSSENVRAYQADTSETVVIVSGREALYSNTPLATADRNRCSAETMCQARSNALLTMSSGR